MNTKESISTQEYLVIKEALKVLENLPFSTLVKQNVMNKQLLTNTQIKARAKYLRSIKAPKYDIGHLVTDLHDLDSCYVITGIKYSIAYNNYLYLLTHTDCFSTFWVTEDNLKLYE